MTRKETTLMPIERLHEHFNAMYDRAEELRGLVAALTADGVDLGTVHAMLKQTESEKRAALAALRLARHEAIVSYPAGRPANSAQQLRRVP